MTIGFDAKRLFQNFTGLGNYSRFVVSALRNTFPENEYVLFAPKIKTHPDTRDFLSGRYHLATPSGLGRLFHPVWRAFGQSLTRAASRLNVYHGLSHELPYGLPKNVKKVVTVHDLIFYRYPEFYNPFDVAIYQLKVKSACARADRIVAISRQTADDIRSFLKVPDEKISVVYQGCHPQFTVRYSKQDSAVIRKKYNLPAQYLLMVGTIEKRKNAKLAVEALARLPENVRIPLVLVGRRTAYTAEVLECARQLKVTPWVEIVDNVSFPDLPPVYQEAELFLYPSLFEGFGIPIIEAMWSGVPVIASTGSCFAEAGGPHSIYVPQDPDLWAGEIIRLLRNPQLRSEMAEQSLQYVQQFKPEVIARKMMDVYDSLI